MNKRKNMMEEKFKKFDLPVLVHQGVSTKDDRIQGRNLCDAVQKTWSVQYGHLSMIHHFYHNTEDLVGIFCEDDILIDKKFKELLPIIIKDFCDMNLDVLLIGYMCSFQIDKYQHFIKNLASTKYNYFTYPNDIWGTQMYILSRASAKEMLDKYYYDYADQTIKNNSLTPFSADWTITKQSKRALLYPLLCIEDLSLSQQQYTNPNDGQYIFRLLCHNFSYEEGKFI
jgi:hypothetical protein